MQTQLQLDDIARIAETGFHIALRVAFQSAMEEVNTFPIEWCEQYGEKRMMMNDPCLAWAVKHSGAIRWDLLAARDGHGVLRAAQSYGLRHGLTVAVQDSDSPHLFSHGNFTRGDRPFTEIETKLLLAYLKRRHSETGPDVALTVAEREALRKVMDGLRLKEIAHDFGVSEGAIKQRLRNAKQKLEARTSTHAVIIAARRGLL